MRRPAYIRASQPCEGMVGSPLPLESAIQSELERVGPVCCITPRHAQDDPRIYSSLSCVLSSVSKCFHPITTIPECLSTFDFRSQPVVSVRVGTYWDANLEEVSVATFSCVIFASTSLNARSIRGWIWSYTQDVFHSTVYGKATPFSPACRRSPADRALVTPAWCFPVSITIGSLSPET